MVLDFVFYYVSVFYIYFLFIDNIKSVFAAMATSTVRWTIQMETPSHRDREAERVLRLRSNTFTETPRYIYRESALSIYIAWGAKF